VGSELFVPSALLSTGMCLVDTPGLGSVWTGNTAATQAFVPRIDAALVVVGADPPLAGEELALVDDVGRQVQNLILVLNKADRTTDYERAAAVGFTNVWKTWGRSGTGESFSALSINWFEILAVSLSRLLANVACSD